MSQYLFSSESVTEGHPDKICDQISDAILDDIISKDPNAKVACEVLATKNIIFIAGEISTSAKFDPEAIARETLKKIGYTNLEFGISYDTCKIMTSIQKQSEDIACGVIPTENKEQGAGDQGLMFGYACDETPELMPLPISLAHKLTQRLAKVRKNKTLPWLRPDGKAQVTVKYVNEKPTSVTAIVLSTQHDPQIKLQQIKDEIKEHLIYPVCEKYLTKETKLFINPTGVFATGGPEADTGVTGRKIIVDTYGGMGRHGGGCFSGKDASKVDRSATYMARYIAKNIVAAKLASKCEVQLAYSIGISEPISVYVYTFNTGIIDDTEIALAVSKIFPLKPAKIIDFLKLKRPIFFKTSTYGHFGREEKEFTWEQTNKVNELKQELKTT